MDVTMITEYIRREERAKWTTMKILSTPHQLNSSILDHTESQISHSLSDNVLYEEFIVKLDLCWYIEGVLKNYGETLSDNFALYWCRDYE